MTDTSSRTKDQMPTEARGWAKRLAHYKRPSNRRGLFEMAVTVLPFIAFWALAWDAIYLGYWPLSFIPSFIAAAFLVRLFMIQHDCGHGSFFSSQKVNDWIGRFIGILTLTPYDAWRRNHAIHHASTGHLERRGIGDIATLTVAEYHALPFLKRLGYRLYRNPVVLFVFGSAYLFLLRHRFPLTVKNEDQVAWVSPMITNLGIAAFVTGLIWLVGIGPFLMVQLPITLLAASIGVWLFYIQHQFDGTFWAPAGDWNPHEAALRGSSHYDLPHVLRWFTGNIGIHHVHHLSSRIPFYRLRQVLRDHPELQSVNRLTLWQSLRCIPLALWDENRKRLVSFRTAKRNSRASA